jgi:hypothetical protein
MLGKYDLTFWPHTQGAPAWALWSGLPTKAAEDGVNPAPDSPRVYLWTPASLLSVEGTLDHLNQLRAAGWERRAEGDLRQADLRLYHIWGQLGDIRGVIMPGQNDQQIWARSCDLRLAREHPVALAFDLDLDLPYPPAPPVTAPHVIRVVEVLPPPQLGTKALAWANNDKPGMSGWQVYELSTLPTVAQELQARLAAALRDLAEPSEWIPIHPTMAHWLGELAKPSGYNFTRLRMQSDRALFIGDARQQLDTTLRDMEATKELHDRIQQARHKLNVDEWLRRWEEIQEMAQRLAGAYWAAHQHEERTASLPTLTSAHRTFVPSHNATRSLWQTFGPGVQPSVWNLDPSNQTIELRTPNQSLVRVTPQEGQEGPELAFLHRHVLESLTPEGIKHAVGVLSAYADQTGGVDQKLDARVSLRQLLLRMGKPESHADDVDEQRRVYHTIVYLARCYVHASDRPEDPRPPGAAKRRKGREYREYSPMLVIERVQFEEQTTDGESRPRVPREVTFHLGADYYHLLFGQGRNFFTIPTALLLSYHPDREQQELLLAMYLSDMLAWNRNPWRVTLYNLILQSALRSKEQLASGHDRLRDTMRILLALERLECDGLLLRQGHPEIDTALACELAQGHIRADMLAEATRNRLHTPHFRMLATATEPALIRERRRRALQSLLGGTTSPLVLSAGPLLRQQVEQREAKRKAAAEHSEHALAARVVKLAMRKVVDAAQNGGQPGGATPGTKRRGRPRKSQ